MRVRLVLVFAALGAVLACALAGCGGGGGSSPDPATAAPPASPLFIDAVIRPQGELKAHVEALAKNVAGIEDPGALIVSKLETALDEHGEKINYGHDIEPWLGEKAGIFFEHYDGTNFSDLGAIVQSTDTAATREFINRLAKSSKTPVSSASYKGVAFKVDGADHSAVGVVGNFLVFGENEEAFKNAVDASQGESLAKAPRYTSATSAEPAESLLSIYADIGGLIEGAGTPATSQTLSVLKAIGFDPTDATAVASVVPGSEQIEIDLATNAGGVQTTSESATGLLGSMPSESVAAVAAAGFGAQLKKAIDGIDAAGIPPSVPPHQLKSTLAQAGINLDKIAGSITDAGAFVRGQSSGSLSGAAVLSSKSSAEASETVADVGLLLRHAGVPGLTAVSGRASGFSVRNPQLGPNPLVVASSGGRISIGYGLSAALQGLRTESSSSTLAEDPTYKAASQALGSTPISGFVDTQAALRLAEKLGASSDSKFQVARPYLSKTRFLAIGSTEQSNLATTKLIVGFEK